MKTTAKWITYLFLSLISFLFFMLEIVSLLVLEPFFLQRTFQNYTAFYYGIHSLMTAGIWVISILLILRYSHRHLRFPKWKEHTDKITVRGFIITLFCMAGCKWMTWIDWGTLKIIGEYQIKEPFQFLSQYLYYFVEVGLVFLIIIYGQKAFEVLLKRDSVIPYGGMVLAFTWGMLHFVSRFNGVEVWNGISCMLFSLLCGIGHVQMKKKYGLLYCFIAIGYLL